MKKLIILGLVAVLATTIMVTADGPDDFTGNDSIPLFSLDSGRINFNRIPLQNANATPFPKYGALVGTFVFGAYDTLGQGIGAGAAVAGAGAKDTGRISIWGTLGTSAVRLYYDSCYPPCTLNVRRDSALWCAYDELYVSAYGVDTAGSGAGDSMVVPIKWQMRLVKGWLK
jgi:hypothetical protein